VPEAVYAIGTALVVLAANGAAMGIWWTRTHGTATDAVVYLAGTLAVLLLVGAGAVTLRHPLARRVAVGAVACAVVVDAVLIGYELSGTTLLSL
jgi:hypothetical protein